MRIHTLIAVAIWLPLVAVGKAEPPRANDGQARADAAPPLAEHELQPDVKARVGRDGSLRLIGQAGGTERVLLEMPAVQAAGAAAAGEPAAFAGRFREGDERGQRGFAPRADDDGDGRVDEDRADGRDNDGDGRTDEDFAAISDAMAVVHSPPAGLHLEFYRWAYAHLRPTLFLSWQQDGPSGSDAVLLKTDALVWRETDLTWFSAAQSRQDAAQRATIVVAAAGEAARAADRIWIGVARLPEGSLRDRRPMRLDGERLRVPLDEGSAALAISVAPTLLQLRFNLAQALVVHRGAAGQTDGGRVPWIVPPLRPAWMPTDAPRIHCETAVGGWRLWIDLRAGDDALIDPDRFVAGERRLGSPRALLWEPATETGAEPWTVAWLPPRPEVLPFTPEDEQDPYLAQAPLRQSRAEGRLGLEFAGAAPCGDQAQALVVEGWYLCGRGFKVDAPCATPLGATADAADAADAATRAHARAPSEQQGAHQARDLPLSPELLDNYPNPFRFQTRVRFRVPATVEEAFAGSPDGARLPLDPAAPMPYASTPPQISLRVYSLTGQEIRTLHAGPLGAGQYETVWNGADHTGRGVASGTYFCKLQVEGWSVTKRIVFVR